MAMQPFNPGFGWSACPTCGWPMGAWMGTYLTGGQPRFMGYGFQPGYAAGFGMPGYPLPMPPTAMPMGYRPRMLGAFAGPATDEQIRDMVYESLDADPIIPYDAAIDVDVVGGVVSLTGTVPNRRIKHAAGDDAWWIPSVVDVNNNLQVARPRRGAAAEGAAEQSTREARR